MIIHLLSFNLVRRKEAATARDDMHARHTSIPGHEITRPALVKLVGRACHICDLVKRPDLRPDELFADEPGLGLDPGPDARAGPGPSLGFVASGLIKPGPARRMARYTSK